MAQLERKRKEADKIGNGRRNCLTVAYIRLAQFNKERQYLQQRVERYEVSHTFFQGYKINEEKPFIYGLKNAYQPYKVRSLLNERHPLTEKRE